MLLHDCFVGENDDARIYISSRIGGANINDDGILCLNEKCEKVAARWQNAFARKVTPAATPIAAQTT